MLNKTNLISALTLVMVGVFSISNVALAQTFKTSTGKITFFSKTSAENIEATNSQVSAAVRASDGKVEFSVPVNSFQFKKSLMKKHFEENYMETAKFPKATFSGTVQNNTAVNYAKDGTYNVTVKGKLTMHGVTKDVTSSGTITVKGGVATLKSNFKVKLADYNIKVPAANAASIAKEIEISVDCACKK